MKVLTLCFGGWVLLTVIAHLSAEIFWFQEVGYLPVFLLRLITQGLLWVGVAGCTIAYFRFNLKTVDRFKHELPDEPRSTKLVTILSLRLRTLLPLTLSLSLLIGFMLVHYGQIAWQYWQASEITVSLFNPIALWQITQQLRSQVWYPIIAIVAAIPILIYPQFLLNAIAIVFSLLFGFILSQHWITVLQSFNPTTFDTTEPLFNQDVSFYVFTLPVVERLSLWLSGLSLYGLISVSLSYLLSGNSLSEGQFLGFSSQQQRHLFGVGSVFMIAIALSYWLSRYELLYSSRGVTYGAGYTDINVQLPTYLALGFTQFLSIS